MAAAGQHIRVERLVGFMLEEIDLTVDEHEHFLHCHQCRENMAKDVSEELKRRSNTSSGREMAG